MPVEIPIFMLYSMSRSSNPFDFNEDEASKQFEHSIIFGVSPHDSDYVSAHDFMKKSMVAANMQLDDQDDLSHIVASSKGSVTNTKHHNDSKYHKHIHTFFH